MQNYCLPRGSRRRWKLSPRHTIAISIPFHLQSCLKSRTKPLPGLGSTRTYANVVSLSTSSLSPPPHRLSPALTARISLDLVSQPLGPAPGCMVILAPASCCQVQSPGTSAEKVPPFFTASRKTPTTAPPPWMGSLCAKRSVS